MKKENRDDSWIRICLLPLIIGFSLVVANVSGKFFKVIGWILLIWGLAIGSFYLFKLYKVHRVKILKLLMKVYLVKRREIK